jgi:hypothetical protein
VQAVLETYDDFGSCVLFLIAVKGQGNGNGSSIKDYVPECWYKSEKNY